MRQYVRERKQTLGLRVVPEAFVPQQYAWGDEAQVDWYEADVDLDGERVTRAGVCDAQHGQWGGISSGLPTGDAAGVPGSPRVGVSATWGVRFAVCATTTSAQR